MEKGKFYFSVKDSLDENSDFLIVEDLNHLNVKHTFFETRIMKMVENIFFNKFKNKGKDKKTLHK